MANEVAGNAPHSRYVPTRRSDSTPPIPHGTRPQNATTERNNHARSGRWSEQCANTATKLNNQTQQHNLGGAVVAPPPGGMGGARTQKKSATRRFVHNVPTQNVGKTKRPKTKRPKTISRKKKRPNKKRPKKTSQNKSSQNTTFQKKRPKPKRRWWRGGASTRRQGRCARRARRRGTPSIAAG